MTVERKIARRKNGWALVKIGINRGSVVPDNHMASDAEIALIPEHRIFSLGKATMKFRSLTQATR